MTIPTPKPTPNYTIRLYEPGDEEAINNGFNEIFGTTRPLDEWRWKFQTDHLWIVVAFDEDGKIISHYGALRERMKFGDTVYTVAQPVDSYRIRRPSTAQSPVFVETGLFFFQHYGDPVNLPFMFGFPGDHAKHVGNRHLDYSEVVEIYLWEKPVSGRRLPWQSVDLGETPPSAADVDDLWARSAPRYPISLVRDGERLQRRFVSHRSQTYHYLTVQEQGRLAAFGVLLQVGDALKWIELVWDGENPKALTQLESKVVRLGQHLGASRLEMWLRGDPQAAKILVSQGWTSHEDSRQPYLLGRSWTPTLPVEEFLKKNYLMMGDSDLV